MTIMLKMTKMSIYDDDGEDDWLPMLVPMMTILDDGGEDEDVDHAEHDNGGKPLSTVQ